MGAFYNIDTRPYVHGKTADVFWIEGGRPGYIKWLVVDYEGHPFPEADITYSNDSGPMTVTMDNRGCAEEIGGGIVEIRLNSRVVLQRHWAPLSSNQGLFIMVVEKKMLP
jgi:hypothetical protein